MAEKVECGGGGGENRPGGLATRPACIFDGLPPGPDMAALSERMERDMEARVLACLDRALARLGRVADSEPGC